MRKLNLKNYTVRFRVPDKMNPGHEIEAEYPYHVKTTILNLMFNSALQLSNAEVVRQYILATKLEQCKDDEILLEEEEYERIKTAFETFKGYSKADVELVTRIDEAEVVEVEEK